MLLLQEAFSVSSKFSLSFFPTAFLPLVCLFKASLEFHAAQLFRFNVYPTVLLSQSVVQPPSNIVSISLIFLKDLLLQLQLINKSTHEKWVGLSLNNKIFIHHKQQATVILFVYNYLSTWLVPHVSNALVMS